MRLHRTPSLHDRKWRNEENENWANIEDMYSAIEETKEFLKGFDGNQLIKKSYNLFNKKMVTEGQIVPSTGAIGSGNYWVTDYIEVMPGKRLNIKPTQGVTAIYDSNLNFIEQMPSDSSPYLLPSGARYIRTQMSKASLDEKYIYLGDEDLPYAEYGYTYMPEFIEFVKNISGESVGDYINLFNKNNVTEGQIVPSTGAIGSGDYWVTEYIEVVPNKEIQLRPTEGTMAVYDSNKNFIKSYLSGEEPKIVPPDGKYIRNQMSKISLDEKYIYMGTEDMPYYPYGEGPNTSGWASAQKEIKILGLGNSYSNDTFWMLKDIAESAGYKVTVGISHLSGGTLSQVYDAINGNGTVTTYNKFTASGLNARTDFNAKDIITDEEWDYIFIQQASTSAMDYATYQPALGNLVSYLKANATNSSVKLGMNMPWVRPISHSTIGTAEKQLQVNAAIVDACQQAMFNESLDIFIPTGIAIMNGRSNEYLAQVSDELTKDGSHLDEGIGRYLAALTAFNAIFGEVADGNIVYSPDDTNNFHCYLSKISAKKAVIEPFEVTKV